MVVTELRMMTPGFMGLLIQAERAPAKCWSSRRRSQTSTPRMPYFSHSAVAVQPGGKVGGVVVTELRMMTPGFMGLLKQAERAPAKCWKSRRRSQTSTPRMLYFSHSAVAVEPGGR